jgi:hypothetical protein
MERTFCEAIEETNPVIPDDGAVKTIPHTDGTWPASV